LPNRERALTVREMLAQIRRKPRLIEAMRLADRDKVVHAAHTASPMVTPPSATIVWPVTKEPAAEARNTAMPAISRG